MHRFRCWRFSIDRSRTAFGIVFSIADDHHPFFVLASRVAWLGGDRLSRRENPARESVCVVCSFVRLVDRQVRRDPQSERRTTTNESDALSEKVFSLTLSLSFSTICSAFLQNSARRTVWLSRRWLLELAASAVRQRVLVSSFHLSFNAVDRSIKNSSAVICFFWFAHDYMVRLPFF